MSLRVYRAGTSGLAGPRQWQTESRKAYDAADDMRHSLEDCYAAVRARKAAGGPGWPA